MKKFLQMFLIIMATILLIQCESDLLFSPKDHSQTDLLKYEFTHGWTGRIRTITVFNDYTAVETYDTTSIDIEFSSEEFKTLKTALENYSSFKRYYRPESGAWFDIDTHEFIYYGNADSDSVSIYEPLDTPDIPVDLINLTELLMSKF